MKRFALTIFCIITFLVLITGCSFKTANESRNSDVPNSLVVGVVNVDLPPHIYTEEPSGALIGFDVDLIDKIFKKLDVDISVVQLVSGARELALDHKEIDVIFGNLRDTSENRLVAAMTDPYIVIPQVMVLKDDSDISEVNDLTGKNISVLQETPAAQLVSENYFKTTFGIINSSRDWHMAINELKQGNVEAILTDEAIAQWMAKELGKGYVISPDSVVDVGYSVAFRLEDESLCLSVSQVISDMLEDGTLSKLSKKWYGKDYYRTSNGAN